MSSFVVRLAHNNWEISNRDLIEEANKFLSAHGTADIEYNQLSHNELLTYWESDKKDVLIELYRADDCTLLRSDGKDATSKLKISVNNEVVVSVANYINHFAATGNINYPNEKVSVPKDTVWLLRMYGHERDKRLEIEKQEQAILGM
ncbi:hypothetical protein D3C87_347870 [compost metagenome]